MPNLRDIERLGLPCRGSLWRDTIPQAGSPMRCIVTQGSPDYLLTLPEEPGAKSFETPPPGQPLVSYTGLLEIDVVKTIFPSGRW